MQTYAPPRDPTAVMGKRIVAYIIDWLLAAVIYIVMFVALGDSIETGGFNPCGGTDSPTLCFHSGDTTFFAEGSDAAAIVLVPLLYWLATAVFMQGTTGSTPGKAMLGLKTIRRDTGAICGLGKAFVRSLLLIVDAFFCFLIGLISALVTDGHKRLGDMAAGTAVVNKADVGTPLDGGAGYEVGQQWAAPVAAGYPPPTGAAAPPPPGGYAPPPAAGYAPPPPGGVAAPPPPTGDFGQPPAGEFSQPPVGDFNQQTGGEYGQSAPSEFGQPAGDEYSQPAPSEFGQPSGDEYS
ncbi:MAG: RDD family protein, partial [Acidimicrobiales bacterium]